jgi:hypothetical protein
MPTRISLLIKDTVELEIVSKELSNSKDLLLYGEEI